MQTIHSANYGILLIRSKSNIGPKMDLCGTPHHKKADVEYFSLTSA